MTQAEGSSVILPSGATAPSPDAGLGPAELHPNYEYLLQQCFELCPAGRILDFGCGKGYAVEEGRRRGLDIYGVEAFAEGSGTNIRDYLEKCGMLGTAVRESLDGRIPFPDASFDLVVSNQVFEHVEDLGAVLEEIARVLKPGGHLLALFPTFDTVREGHCRILFAHWLPKSNLRFLWLYLWRSFGFGRLKRGRTRMQWARFFNEWLDYGVHYRSYRSIKRHLRTVFESITHMEEDLVARRLAPKRIRLSRALVIFPVGKFVAWMFRRWCGLVLLARKSSEPVPKK